MDFVTHSTEKELLNLFMFSLKHTHGNAIFTPYNVGSVLWRLFSTLEVDQYIRGITSVLWGDSFSTVGDSFSTVEVVQYSGG